MKKIMTFVLILCTVITVFPTSSASAFSYGNLEYSVIDNEAWVTSGDNASGEVIIPETVQGYPVTHIDANAFWANESIKKITFPKNITVGRYAFANCRGLTTVIFGNGKSVLEDGAFATCVSVKDVRFNKGEIIIGDKAFVGCISLSELNIGPGVKAIGEDAFYWCNIYSITVDPQNPYFSNDGYGALYNKNKTELLICPTDYYDETFTVASTVTSIARKAFSGCWMIETVKINSKVEKIDSTAFYDCYNLKKIIVDSQNPCFFSDSYGVLYSKDKTKLIKFPQDNSNTTYKIASETVEIGDYAFSYCEMLTAVSFPNSLKSIGNEAFISCNNIVKISLPDTVEFIGEYAFENCVNLSEFKLGKNIKAISTGTFLYCNSLKSISLPQTVISIGNSAFMGCSSLTEIVIPNNVESIGEWAFYDCTNIKTVKLPAKLSEIGNYAFRECTAIETVYYDGTQRQWNSLIIGYNNSCLLNAKLVCKTELTSNGVYLALANDNSNPVQSFTANIITNPPKDFELMQYFNAQNTVFYNLNLESSSQQSVEYTVSIPIPEGFDAQKVKPLMLDAQGKATVIPFTAENGYCTFTVAKLGVFAVAERNGKLLSGDFNDDFSVTLQDVVFLSQICAKWDIQYNGNNPDVDGSGVNDLQDVVHLAKYVAGWQNIILK